MNLNRFFLSESANGKKGNENVFIANSIRDEIGASRESDGTSAAHGVTFPGMKIALTGGRVRILQHFSLGGPRSENYVSSNFFDS